VIEGLSKRQKIIVTLLCEAETWDETEAIVDTFGKDAALLRQLIIYETIDELCFDESQFDQAREILERIAQQ